MIFSRALRGRDPDDVVFRAGGEVAFGLATLDGVAKDHNAVAHPIRVLLVDPSTLKGVKE